MFHANKYRQWLKHPGYEGPVAPFLPYIAAGATVVSTIQQASAQKQAAKTQRQIADVQSARERVQAAREARIKRAQILATTGNMGIGPESSGPAGSVSSIGSQTGSNIMYQNTMTSLGNQLSKANTSAANWQAIGGIAGSMTDWKDIFNSGNNMNILNGAKYKTDPFSQQSINLFQQERGF